MVGVQVEAAAKLEQAAALWSLDPSHAVDVIVAACDALVAGLDTPSLRMLAAVSVRGLRGSGHEIAEVLQAALEELGIDYPPPGSVVSREAAVRAMAARLLNGDVSPRELTMWVHHNFGHDLSIAEALAELDDVYDTLPYADVLPEQVDADVRAAAIAIVGRSAHARSAGPAQPTGE